MTHGAAHRTPETWRASLQDALRATPALERRRRLLRADLAAQRLDEPPFEQREARALEAFERRVCVVRGRDELDVPVFDDGPAGIRRALVGHPDAARVDEAHGTDTTVVLDVRMAAHDDVRGDAVELLRDDVLGRDPRED